MKLNIIGLTETGGVLQPDPDKIVARIELRAGVARVDVVDSEYGEDLREIFSKPAYRFTGGAVTHQGVSVDAGLEEVSPGDPAFLSILPEKLSILGLDYVIVEP